MFTGLKNLVQDAGLSLYVQIGVYAAIVLYILIAGLPDVVRLSLTRIWAVSGVCFSESIRRKVLWIIPLALLGVVIVIQLQQSWDPQEDIRQATKFCLFTTGLVVVTSTLILASSSLPREIESRVIFTIVTKPTTRLEIILGKITGFSRMSATILAIMGIFTFGYLHFRAWSLQHDIRERLQRNEVEAVSKPTFEHYVNAGLLNAKTTAGAQSINVYQKPPTTGVRRYPAMDGMVLAPFRLPEQSWAAADPQGTVFKGPGMQLRVRLGYDPSVSLNAPTFPNLTIPGKAPAGFKTPRYVFMVLDPNQNTLLVSELKENSADIPSMNGTVVSTIDVPLNLVAANLTRQPFFYIQLQQAAGGDGTMWIDDNPDDPAVQLDVPVVDTSAAGGTRTERVKPSDPFDPKRAGPLIFKGRDGVTGEQVKGDAAGKTQVCVFHFQNKTINLSDVRQLPIEFKIGVEKSGENGDSDVPTQATVSVYNPATGKESEPSLVVPENNRWFYTGVPTDQITGDFDIRVRCLSDGQWLNVKRNSLLIVQSENSFAWNLFKSLFILWLLSVLVTTIAVCCSTFLSWPIAVVLTIVILFSHWGVDQLGDSANAGVGRNVAQDFGLSDPAKMRVVSDSVEALNKMLKQVSAVLPDIDQFSATEDIDHGINIATKTVLGGAWVLLGFGLPFSAAAYIRLKNMEVAP